MNRKIVSLRSEVMSPRQIARSDSHSSPVETVIGSIQAYRIRTIIQEQLVRLVRAGDIDMEAIRSTGMNVHIYRTVKGGARVFAVLSTDEKPVSGGTDAITRLLRKKVLESDVGIGYIYIDDICERFDDLEELKRIAERTLRGHDDEDVRELLRYIQSARDFFILSKRRRKSRRLGEGVISLGSVRHQIKRIRERVKEINWESLNRKIREIERKAINWHEREESVHYFNYPLRGPRGIVEKIEMFERKGVQICGRENVGIHLRVASEIKGQNEVMIISINPWRGAHEVFRNGDRDEIIRLLQVLVHLIANNWSYSRLRIEGIRVERLESFDLDDLFSLTVGVVRGRLDYKALHITDPDIRLKIERILSWGPVWNLDEILLVVAMKYGFTPSRDDLVRLISQPRYRDEGIVIIGDDEMGFYVSIKELKDKDVMRGISAAGQRRERESLGLIYSE